MQNARKGLRLNKKAWGTARCNKITPRSNFSSSQCHLPILTVVFILKKIIQLLTDIDSVMQNELFNPLKMISWHVLSGNRQALFFLDKVNIPWRFRDVGNGVLVAHERCESHVYQFGDCYLNETSSQISSLLKIFMVVYFNSYFEKQLMIKN